MFVIVLISTHVSRMKSDNLHRELKIDFHKIDQHVTADLDLVVFNAPCDIVSLGYKDYLGEDFHDIHITKEYVNSQGRSDGAPQFDWNKPVNTESVKSLAREWPGCKLKGKFNNIMKVKGIITVGFEDHISVFNDLANSENIKLNLDHKVFHLKFGATENNEKIEQTLKPYHEDIHTELNVFLNETEVRKGKFNSFMYIQIFPFEVIDDTKKENFTSFQYSLTKNYKQMETGIISMQGPSINFELEFLPVISVYHIKVVPRFKTLISILGACGGLFAIFGILNAFLSTISEKMFTENL